MRSPRTKDASPRERPLGPGTGVAARPPRARRPGLTLLAFCGAIALFFGAGCGRNPAREATESDANGYLCAQCQTRFRTDARVFAEFCPGCKSTDLLPVVGYVCGQDQTVVLVAKGAGGAVCTRCNRVLTSVKLPQAKELEAWGATRKERKDVCAAPK
jgi:DNA-directed RNA polymerase subunit RPC12/RpoP